MHSGKQTSIAVSSCGIGTGYHFLKFLKSQWNLVHINIDTRQNIMGQHALVGSASSIEIVTETDGQRVIGHHHIFLIPLVIAALQDKTKEYADYSEHFLHGAKVIKKSDIAPIISFFIVFVLV